MSHDGTWRASCRISLLIPPIHFGSTFHRTRRDKSRRWLWRLVSRLVFPRYRLPSDFIRLLRGNCECRSHLGFAIANSTPRRPTPRIFFSKTHSHTRDPQSKPLSHHANNPPLQVSVASRGLLLANVKDEPRRDLARLVPHLDFHSAVSFRNHIPSHEA
jgi:hypothetical protein